MIIDDEPEWEVNKIVDAHIQARTRQYLAHLVDPETYPREYTPNLTLMIRWSSLLIGPCCHEP